MKQHTRILYLLLSLFMVILLMVACSPVGGDSKETQANGGTADTENPDDGLADLGSYDGQEIIISLSKFTSAQIVTESYQYIQGPDSMTSDSVLNKVFDRNADISNSLDINPRYVYTALSYQEIMPDIQQKVLAPGKNTPDFYVDQAWGLIRAQQSGFLKNVICDESKLDINSEGWLTDYMKAFNFNSEEKLYLLAGDYTMDVIRFLHTIACNLTTFENSFTKSGGKQLLYDTVYQGQWTYDQLMTWCEVVFTDNGKNTGIADVDDKLGLVTCNTGLPVMGWVPSVNVVLYDIDESGHWSVHAKNDERAIKVIDKLIDLMGSTQGVLFASGNDIGGDAGVREVFINGNALFTSGVLLSDLETTEYQQMEDDKCLIPYPKIVESDEYYVTTHDGARVGGILINCEGKRFTAVTAWLQAMALSSKDILDEYYNVALKFKYGTDLGTTKMLDVIYENIRAPYWITAYSISESISISWASADNPLGFWHNTTPVTSSNIYVSKYAAIKSSLGRALSDFKTTFERLD